MRTEAIRADAAAAVSGVIACSVPRIAHAFSSSPASSARTSSPGAPPHRTATAVSATDVTCAYTPASRRATATASPASRASTNPLRNRHANTWPHVAFTAPPTSAHPPIRALTLRLSTDNPQSRDASHTTRAIHACLCMYC